MRKRELMPAALLLALSLTLTGCGASINTITETAEGLVNEVLSDSEAEDSVTIIEGTATPTTYFSAKEDAGYVAYAEDATKITLSGDTATIDGEGASLSSDGTLYITADGEYVLSGSYSGTIAVECTGEKDDVTLYLNGVTLTSTDYAAIVCYSADNLILSVVPGTENTISDGSSYTLKTQEDNTDAAIFSKSDLTINGSGSLTVTGNYNNGIVSKDDLLIVETSLTVNSVDDGICGKDSVEIQSGEITVNAGGKGIEATNEEDAEKGFILVTGGTITVNSTDDAFHAVNVIQVDDGKLTVSTQDDGFHSDSELVINNGTIRISDSYEGLEGNVITINGGSIELSSSDDGINVAGGNDASGTAGNFGQDAFETDSSCVLTINGGTILVNAKGDGLDSNGSIVMNGGTVTLEGPTDSANGSLDFGLSFDINGGTFLVAGSSGMAQYPSDSSTQHSLIYYLDSNYAAGTSVILTNANGEEVISFVPDTAYNFVIISIEALKEGETYTLLCGSDEMELTVDNINNIYGSGAGMGGFGGMGSRGRMNGEQPQMNGDSTDGSGQRPEMNGEMPEGTDGEMPERPDGEMPEGFDGERPQGGGRGGFGPGAGSDSEG
ncbi:MAG: carbohydrate-binding domain-containing protein [Lachnospiraceae bacterium]|nr:carbohydrate-binding domain-containing protein [Lachnospiraceae bacterium]